MESNVDFTGLEIKEETDNNENQTAIENIPNVYNKIKLKQFYKILFEAIVFKY